ncbi:hypothetical protein [Nonomuraea maritima]|uniref:hypothetical protein n=1 Tax=Nonomuraea maritima TaxID=683260 RepID=UPI0037212DAF
MQRLVKGNRRRTGLVAAVVLAGGLLTATPATAATAATEGVTAAAQTSAAARPSNGRILYDRYSGGRGRLTIKNGTSRDSVITLVKGKTKAISIYVRARSTASIKDVRDGTYRVYFTSGYRFDNARKRFTRSATYQRFDDRLRFVTTSTSYRIYTLSLQPVVGGNARSSAVNPKDFP